MVEGEEGGGGSHLRSHVADGCHTWEGGEGEGTQEKEENDIGGSTEIQMHTSLS